MPQIVIAPLSATPDSRRQLTDLLIETVAHGGSVSFMHPLEPDRAAAFWDGALAAAARGERIVLGAWDGEVLAATVTLILDCPPNQPHRAEIAKMMTRLSHRGRGIAAALLAEAEALAVARGRTLLVLDTAVEDGAAGLYEKRGFVPAGIIPDYALKPHGGLTGTKIYWKRIGSAGDVDYGAVGSLYPRHRRPDPRIARLIRDALGTGGSVLNVGAGTGSYEPEDRPVVAVEPSAAMRAGRPPHLVRAIDATAECLPFPDCLFDAAMAIFTIHQWRDLARGLGELRRVTRGPVVLLTCDPAAVQGFWLNDYAPAVLAAEARRYPSLDAITAALGGRIEVRPVPIPLDCRDGFNEAYYGRPERLLDPEARAACSAWGFVAPAVAEASVETLRRDLEDGGWDRKFGYLRTQPAYDGSLRLVIAER